jgi:nitroreductase
MGGYMADYSELVKNRRSIREFEDRKVSLEVIEEIIEESTLAPSSGNGQPWKFIVIEDPNWIKKLSDESKKNLLNNMERNPDSPSKRYEMALRNPDFNVYYNAPFLVYIAGSKKIGTIYVDCALCASYFMFAAVSRGLGTCWIGLGQHIRDSELRKAIGLPEDHVIVAPIVVGYPKSIIPNVPERSKPQILKILS